MRYSPYATEVVLPEDLADMLGEISARQPPVRSSMLTLFIDGSAIASTAITFLQGPPAISYWVDVTRRWLQHRRASGVGEIKLKGPGGTATFTVTGDTDLAELAGTLHKALFPPRQAPGRDVDDISL